MSTPKTAKKKAPKPRRKGGLSGKQRGYIGALSNRGWKRLKSLDAIDEPETEWRHRESKDATQTPENPDGFTISEAPARCFDALETRFLLLAGETKRAVDRAFGPANDERQLFHTISTTARAAGLGERYIAGICRRMFGRDTWSGPQEGQKVLIALKIAQNRTARRASQPTQDTLETASNPATMAKP